MSYRPNAPFVNYFFKLAPDPQNGANIPNAGGTLTFYADENRSPSGLLPTYSDVNPANPPVVNPNPIELGADGSAPLIYFQDRLYYIEEHDSNGALVRTYERFYYPYTNGGSGGGGGTGNYIPDGQFIFPLDFGKSGNKPGQIYQTQTAVAWATDFIQDAITTTQNFVTFESVANETIDASPPTQIVVTSINAQAGESRKDLRVVIGDVNFSQNNKLSISFEGYSKIAGSPAVNLRLEKYYGVGGSDSEIIDIQSFQMTNGRTQYYIDEYTLPSNSGKTIGEGSTLGLLFQVGLGQTCTVALTNLLCCNSVGAGTRPIYPNEGLCVVAAKVVGDAIQQQLSLTTLFTIYQRYGYGGVSNIINVSDTGKLFLAVKTALFPDAVRCTGQAYKTTDYNDINIPYDRLYKGQPGSIGTTFGSTGDLIITSNTNVVTFTLGKGGREKNPYTNGTAGAALTVAQTIPGQKQGVSCVLKTGTSDTVEITWVSKFTAVAPPFVDSNHIATSTFSDSGLGTFGFIEQYPTVSTPNIGNFYETYTAWLPSGTLVNPAQAPGYFTITDTADGSPTVQAVSTIQFNNVPNTQYVASYTTQSLPAPIVGANFYGGFFEWATNPADTYLAGVNARARAIPVGGPGWAQASITPGVSVSFGLDGKTGNQFAGSQTAVVPLLSTDSIAQAVNKFISVVDNPFVDTVTVNSAPAASTYFLFSSDVEDYYGWFKVDGVGTDPMVADRTAEEIDISATDTTTQIATKIKTALDAIAIKYKVPDEENLDHVPSAVSSECLTGYFIYL